MRKILLICGILSMLLYVAMNIFVPMYYPGYDHSSQTISELSAIDSPTRSLWIPLSVLYSLLFVAFGAGVWLSAGKKHTLRLVGAVIAFDAIFGFFWPPMHRRDVIAAGGGTLTDTLHLVWAFVHLLLMMLMIGFGASAFNKKFRIFSVVVVLVFLLFGTLTGFDSKGIEANLPTPYLGIWERINIAAYMAWIVAFACLSLKRDNENIFGTAKPL